MRTLLIVLDSVGCGNAPDAATYGDAGANTLAHILEEVPSLRLSNLEELGLREILTLSAKGTHELTHLPLRCGVMRSATAGKDTTSGHWEIAGVILPEPFPVFEFFPQDFIQRIEAATGVEFIGNVPASGTEIIERLGPEHLRSGKPILYTSADSVLQIAAHQDVMPEECLHALCKNVRVFADELRIGRVIARPFRGQPGAFERTPGRHDYSIEPPRTVLDALVEAEVPVTGIGKIADIFAGRGITQSFPTASNAEEMRKITSLWRQGVPGLLFANLVDFDMRFGHRRDVKGYANALAEFDLWLGAFVPEVREEDLVLITADHGNDPTWIGTDHTREQVPLWILGIKPGSAPGIRATFADVAASLAARFGIADRWFGPGSSFL